jgi:hypothetical protein
MAKKAHQTFPVGLLSHFFIDSALPYLSIKKSHRIQPIQIMGTNAHLPIIGPNRNATPKFTAMIRNGDKRTIRLSFISF